MERKSLIRELVRRLMELHEVETATGLAASLKLRGLDVSNQAITSWLTAEGWQRIPDPPMLAELLTLAGITDAVERVRYFDPIPPDRTQTRDPLPAA